MQPEALAENAMNVPASSGKPFKVQRVEEEPLRVKKLTDLAIIPKRGSAGAAGYDLARQAPWRREGGRWESWRGYITLCRRV